MNKFILKTILFMLIILLIPSTIYICELYLNHSNFQKKPIFLDFTDIGLYKNYRLDSDLVYIVDSNKYRNNINKYNPNKINISFIGDSVTWSYGASDSASYPITFEKLFNQESILTKAIQVNNFGVPGFGLDQEYILAKDKIIPEFTPNILIWNINFNDLWDSNFTCLFTQKNNQWLKITGTNNTSYWYGYFKTHFPKFITNSKLSNLIWSQSINNIVGSSGDGRYTFGCTSPQKEWTPELQNNIIKKLNYFIGDLNVELKKSHSELIITLVPYQKYFSNQYSFDSLDLAYKLIKDNLQKQDIYFIDYNEVILKQLDSDFYQKFRNPNEAYKTPVSSPSSNLSQQYFLDSNIDLAQDNWRHPNQKMYNLMAKNLTEYLKKLRLTL